MFLMRNVLLVIRADFGTFIAVKMPLSQANDFITKFKDGKLPPVIGGDMPDGGNWAFESKRITLLHTQELEQTTQPMQQGSIPNQFQRNLSGY